MHVTFRATTGVVVLAMGFGVFAAPQPTWAQQPALTLQNAAAQARSAQRYWTPERLAAAKPMRAGVRVVTVPPEAVLHTTGTPKTWDARPPALDVAPDPTNLLYDPADVVVEPEADVEPADKGTLGAHFSSSRLIGAVHTKYPYSTVGKLFFTQVGVGDFVCSASVISRRIVVTAGHCVHQGSGGSAGFYTNFQFIPGFKNGVAPFGTWNWAFVIVTGTWASGGGTVPNAADYAMIELRDAPGLVRIGDVTGSLGFQTLSLSPNHATSLGYPCNLDNCQQMHQVTAQSLRNTSPNNVEYGSDARGGQSGGPWVQNFGKKATGQSGGLNAGVNRVIGVTSYGYNSLDPKVLGGSVPDARWTDIFNTACAHRSGNC